jgi:hypothetical protein
MIFNPEFTQFDGNFGFSPAMNCCWQQIVQYEYQRGILGDRLDRTDSKYLYS